MHQQHGGLLDIGLTLTLEEGAESEASGDRWFPESRKVTQSTYGSTPQ